MKSYLILLAVYLSISQNLFAQKTTNQPSVHYSPFIENKGQWDHDLLFRSDFGGGRIFLHKNKIRFGFLDHDDLEILGTLHHDYSERGKNLLGQHVIHGHIYEMEFVDANKNSEITSLEKQSFYHNYFLGNDKTKWAGNVGLYGQVVYSELWEGIDLNFKEEYSSYKYDFIVKPGADISQIKLSFEGQINLEVKDGKLIITTSVNTVVENEPYVYQKIGGRNVEVACNYILEDGLVSFDFPLGFNSAYELIIDPVLVFSTYSGSTTDNWGFTATYNDQGNYYGGGVVFGTGYPITSGAFQTTFGGITDVAISKYTSDGSEQLYATYLGGSETDVPHSMIVDNQDNLIVLGTTSSSDFPVNDDAYDDSFNGGSFVSYSWINYNSGSDIYITKFSSNGSELIGSTFIGGSENDGLNMANDLVHNFDDQLRGEVFINEENQIYVASSTQSSNFPTTAGSMSQTLSGQQDGCAIKMASDLSGLLWSTYIGGNDDDAGYSIKVTGDEALICGGTNSSDFPATTEVINSNYHGFIDGYIVNLNASIGSLNYATFLGTNLYDQAYYVDIDKNGDVYVLGQTKGLYPVSPNVYSNPNSSHFIHILSPNFSSTILSTVFGDGSRSTIDLSLAAFKVDDCSNIYVSGWGGGINYEGSTSGLPTTQDAFQGTTSDGSGMYFIVLEKNFQNLLYASHFGGSGLGEHVHGGTSRFDNSGTLFQAVCACLEGMLTTPGAWSTSNGNISCNLGSIKMDMGFVGIFSQIIVQSNLGCAPFEVEFLNLGNGIDFIWDFGDGSPLDTTENPTHTYTETGEYIVTLIAIDSMSCSDIADTSYLQITVFDSIFLQANFNYAPNFDDSLIYFTNTGTTGLQSNGYFWDFGDGSFSNIENPNHFYTLDGIYNVTEIVSDTGFCSVPDTITLPVTVDFGLTSITDLSNDNLIIYHNQNKLEIRSLEKNKPVELTLYNTNGLKIKSFKVHLDGEGKSTINLPILVKGIYLVRYKSNDLQKVVKFVYWN